MCKVFAALGGKKGARLGARGKKQDAKRDAIGLVSCILSLK